MAIDTATKRFSIMDADVPMSPGMTPPDAATPAGDRLAMMWLYSGVTPAAVVYNWRVPANTNGITRYVVVLADNWQSILDNGQATSSGGYFAFQASSNPALGEKRLVFVHNWDADTATQSIFGGAAIAEAVVQ